MTPEELAELEASEAELTDSEKIELISAKIDALLLYQGLKLRQIDEHQFEVIKDIPAPSESGTYLDPIHFVDGMSVTVGLWYIFPDENIWECIKSGNASYTSEYFDIIEV